jgi:phospholipase/carboxylesterase
MNLSDPHGEQSILTQGVALARATKAYVLLHGRGASAQNILELGYEVGDGNVAFLAPQAAQNTWYPNSFLAPIKQNQPWLDSALAKVAACIDECNAVGLGTEQIAVIGFSQGACLASEFVARNPSRYGALIAFTGGLIGPPGSIGDHSGSLFGTPIFLTSGDHDPHVPWSRVEETRGVFLRMGGDVRLARHANRPHTILEEEIDAARLFLSTSFPPLRP